MILVVNTTSDTSVTEEIRKQAADKSIDIDIVEASELKISHCIGCNFCWLKTPGECAVKDDYEIILKKLIHADQYWVISDTALGNIDHKGKNVFDRILPILTMNLHFVGGQMRHISRYGRNADVGLIVRGETDKEYLERWTERATLNLESRSLGVFGVSQIKEAVSCMC